MLFGFLTQALIYRGPNMTAETYPYFRLCTLYHQDIPRYVNPHDPMVKAIERGRWAILSSGEMIVYGKTSLIGALVRYEPAFQHYDDSQRDGLSLARDLLGALGTVISGEYMTPYPPKKDFRFTNILWHGFGYSKDMSEKPEWLTQTVRVVGLAGDKDEAG